VNTRKAHGASRLRRSPENTIGLMTFLKIIASGFIVLLLALPASWVSAQDAAAAFAERFATGSIDTTERAQAALDEIGAARTAVDKFYSDQRVACYSRFFASACLSDVRQRQRLDQSKIRKIEVEANALLRKEKAAERDRALAERDNRAKQQPGSRSRPISGTARESAPEVTEPAATATSPETHAEVPAEAPAEAPANSKP
jgi:colicin import membrane protein